MKTLARNWWLLVLRGVAAIAFGVLTIVWPGASLASLVVLFGVYSLVEGFTSLGLAFMKAEGRVGTWIVHSVVGVAAGVLTLAYPGITAIALYAIIAGWALATGIVEIFVAVALRGVGGRVGDSVRHPARRASGGRGAGTRQRHRHHGRRERHCLGGVRRAVASRRVGPGAS